MTKRNPGGRLFGTRLGTLRWRLVLWLTGGSIEAVPFFGLDPIPATSTIRVTLGQPGHLNTAEVER